MQVLRPRFQGKLFKAPGSVHYRRLFPFLRDTVRDNSGNYFVLLNPLLIYCFNDYFVKVSLMNCFNFFGTL